MLTKDQHAEVLRLQRWWQWRYDGEAPPGVKVRPTAKPHEWEAALRYLRVSRENLEQVHAANNVQDAKSLLKQIKYRANERFEHYMDFKATRQDAKFTLLLYDMWRYVMSMTVTYRNSKLYVP